MYTYICIYVHICVYIYMHTYCKRFALPPRQLRLGGWSLGARGSRFLHFGEHWVPLVCLGVPGGSLGAPRIFWDVLEALGSLWKLLGGSLRSRGLRRELWKSLKNSQFLLDFHQSPKTSIFVTLLQ